ncbi:MAG: helix-turn-helix domain-containing protein, partial [Acetobacter papayae]
VMALLMRHDWPGNVRELQNEILRMLVLTEDDTLGAELLSPALRFPRAALPHPARPPLAQPYGSLHAPPTPATQDNATAEPLPEDGSMQERLDTLEARILAQTIARCGWNKSLTARELGLSRVGLRAKLERYGIVPEAVHRPQP